MSKSSTAAIATGNLHVGGLQPAAPAALNQEARQHWERIVAARPDDYFAEGNLQLLAHYCRTLVLLRRASDLLDTIDAADVGHFAEQVEIVSRLTTMAVMLATKLRLTIQSSVRGDAGILSERRTSGSPLLGGNITSLERH
ncbi:MAG TPA: hypothetical protein VHL31_07700 [Geminicoccus sp.]|jgi:phage terminase small subunit|uniref:hypothetical protein n=1 Tax=Geminicoccus sp. TaxID=2024832 RepID=UPI002E338D6A|nr:hypothetical protein [Geminicoccus sp.]HEX2526171.1 hypothetical protein [Geminicoccus sp.]